MDSWIDFRITPFWAWVLVIVFVASCSCLVIAAVMALRDDDWDAEEW